MLQGTGLGLSVSHDIIKKVHAGELTVETIVEEKGMFTVLLPFF